MKTLRLFIGRARSFFGFCPECNSSAPKIYDCQVCFYDTKFPPSREVKAERWSRFVANHMKKQIIILSIMASGLANAQMFAQRFAATSTTWTPASLNPIAWWSFDNISGSTDVDKITAKAMTLTGSPTISAGLRGNAITTAGGKYGSWTDFSTSTSFSISLWIKTAYPNSGMIFLGRSVSANDYMYLVNSTTIRVNYGSTSLNFTIPSFGTDWRLATLTCSGGSIRVYLDGVESTSGAQTATGYNLGRFNQIARFSSGTTYAWNGQIDEMTVYNYTLSQEQILQLYNYR